MYNRLLSSISTRALFAAAGEGGAAPELPLDPPSEQPTAEEVAAPEGAAAEAEAPPETEAPAEAPASDWRDKEIRRKHAQLQEEKRRRSELEAEVEALRKIAERTPAAEGETPAPAQPRQAQPVNDDERVKAEAAKMVAKQNFDTAANDADRSGRERYKGDWEKVTQTLSTLGGFDMDTMQGILATDDPAKVLYELGNKPENYQRIMELPPAKRLAELVKLGLPAPRTPNRPSNAPAPIEPIGGRARPDANELRDDLSDEDWYARRQRQREARWAAKRRA